MKRSIKIIQCDGSAKCVKKLFSVMLGILLLLSLVACRSDAELKETPAPQPPDLTGQWRQVNNETEDSYQGAVIGEEQIEIYLVSNNGDTRSLLWAGSFTAPDTADEPYTWTSQNDKGKTGASALAIADNTLEFSYSDGQISYTATTSGTTQTVRMEKEEWAPGLTIGAGTQPVETAATESLRPANVTYTPFTIAGVEFSIPSYFVEVENEPEDNSNNFIYQHNINGVTVALLIFGEESATGTQSEFNQAKYVLTNNYLKSVGATEALDISDITLAGLSARHFSCITTNDNNLTVGWRVTFAYNPSANKIIKVTLAVTQYPDYLNDDYNTIINTAKLITSSESDNASQESEDVKIPPSGLRPEFKEAMDTYEAFYRDYCDLLKKYSQNPGDLTLLQEYMNMLTKVQEMDKAFDEWDQDDMNSEELKYYLEVHTRILQMLADVNG